MTKEEFTEHAHHVLLHRYDIMLVEPKSYLGGLIGQAGLEKDDDVGYILKMCISDEFTESFYTESFNVQWADERNRAWLAEVLLDNKIRLISTVRRQTQTIIKNKHDDFLKSFGGLKYDGY